MTARAEYMAARLIEAMGYTDPRDRSDAVLFARCVEILVDAHQSYRPLTRVLPRREDDPPAEHTLADPYEFRRRAP